MPNLTTRWGVANATKCSEFSASLPRNLWPSLFILYICVQKSHWIYIQSQRPFQRIKNFAHLHFSADSKQTGKRFFKKCFLKAENERLGETKIKILFDLTKTGKILDGRWLKFFCRHLKSIFSWWIQNTCRTNLSPLLKFTSNTIR